MTDSVREKSENMIRVVAFSTNQKGIIGQGLDGRPDFSVSWMMPTDPQAVAAKAPHLLIVDADLGMPCEAVIRAALTIPTFFEFPTAVAITRTIRLVAIAK